MALLCKNTDPFLSMYETEKKAVDGHYRWLCCVLEAWEFRVLFEVALAKTQILEASLRTFAAWWIFLRFEMQQGAHGISNSECSRKRRNYQSIEDSAIEVARKFGETVSDELSTFKIAEQAAFYDFCRVAEHFYFFSDLQRT